MGDWFMAGGFGMISLSVVGAIAIVLGGLALREPTEARLVPLRSLPSLLGLLAMFSFGTNLWAVNVHLTDAETLAARGLTADAFTALMGFTEAAQPLTLGGLLAAFVVTLRLFAEAKHARAKS